MFDRIISYHARMTPQALAVSTLSGQVTYAEFDAAIDRFAAALAEIDPPKGGLAAVAIADRYIHWVILLALARLGVASASYLTEQKAEMLPLLRPDLVITDEVERPGEVRWARVIRISADWLRAVARRPSVRMPRPKVDRGELARVMTSSGTTGAPKKFGASWAKVERMVEVRVKLGLFGAPQLRATSMIGPEHYPLHVTLGAWCYGGAEIFMPNDAAGLASALPRLQPALMYITPIQLKTLLDAMPQDSLPQWDLTVTVTGAHTPRAVRDAARARLTNRLVLMYSTSECGPIATRLDRAGGDETDVGYVGPHVEVEVVDDAHNPVAFGALGAVRVRGDGLAESYLDDPETTARFFRDGWFYPGDVAAISEDGRLRVEGRIVEVMNFGGAKFMPQTIEWAVLACAGVKDAGAFTLPDADGFDAPWIAIVRDGSVNEHEVLKALTIPGLPITHVVWTDQIPRSPQGKIQRERLQAATRALAATKALAAARQGG